MARMIWALALCGMAPRHAGRGPGNLPGTSRTERAVPRSIRYTRATRALWRARGAGAIAAERNPAARERGRHRERAGGSRSAAACAAHSTGAAKCPGRAGAVGERKAAARGQSLGEPARRERAAKRRRGRRQTGGQCRRTFHLQPDERRLCAARRPDRPGFLLQPAPGRVDLPARAGRPGALEDEITRLQGENAALKKELLAHGMPLPGSMKGDPPPARVTSGVSACRCRPQQPHEGVGRKGLAAARGDDHRRCKKKC